MKVDHGVIWPTLDQAREALKYGDGTGIKVAVIDSGIEVSHPKLNGLTLTDDVLVTCDGTNINFEDGKGVDAYGHGTAIAGVLLDEAPGVSIGSFRALDNNNWSRNIVISEAVLSAISKGYQIINCSFGCRGQPKYVMDYKEWIDLAYLNGAQVVAACSNLDSGIREWPAYFPSVYGVRATQCKSGEFYHKPGSMVSFTALGERVEVPWLGATTKIETGSSYAAPRISGKIAKILSIYPNLNPAMIKPLLASLAETQED